MSGTQSNGEAVACRAMSLIGIAARFAFVAGAVAVTILCLLPSEDLPAVPLWDKLEHLLAYALLAASGGIAYPRRRARLWIALFLLMLGAVIEYTQGFVPGRDASAADMFANAIGILIGIAAAAPLSALLRRAPTATV